MPSYLAVCCSVWAFYGPSPSAGRLPPGLLVAAFALAIMAQVALLWLLAQARFRSDARFVNGTARATAWVGLVATLWTLSPVVLTSACI